MAQARADSSVFASCARYEPFGLAVLEAAQAGMALVLSDIPSLREIWDGAAMFADPRDAAGFAAALRVALDDPAPWAARAGRRATRFPPAPPPRRRLRCCAGCRARASCPRAAWPGRLMRVVYFAHSLASCWNHGNAHFLRGVLRELQARGHDVRAFEPADSWSRAQPAGRPRRGGARGLAAPYPGLLARHARGARRDAATAPTW